MLSIRLLGPPAIEHDGVTVPVRGHKAWALLAMLVLSDRPLNRGELAAMLFSEAADPRGALRWNLAQLRSALGGHGDVGGDPVRLSLGPAVILDLDALDDGGRRSRPPAALPGPLIEGQDPVASAAFETWLLVERRRLAARAAALVRESALRLLASGRSDEATTLARQLVADDPFDEGHHILLVRTLAAAGDVEGARAQASACERRFAQELGRPPSPRLREAVRAPLPARSAAAGRAAALAQLEAGRAALAAGMVDAGLDCLRRAAADADLPAARDIQVEALVSLGGALMHTVRGRDEEAAALLHQALVAGAGLGRPSLLAHAHRELGTADLIAGRRQRAEAWFASADELAAGDDDELSAIAGWRAANLADMGRHGQARALYARSLELARRCGNRRQVAWSEANLGRTHLLCGDLRAAAAALDASIAIAKRERWAAFLPYPETLRAEIARRGGDTGTARELLEHAHALAVQIDDPCYEGLAARGMGLADASEDDLAGAWHWLDAAIARTSAATEINPWMIAFIREARCAVHAQFGQADALAHEADTLLALATRTELADVLVRAQTYRHLAGQDGALELARLAASRLENAELAALIENCGAAPGRGPGDPRRANSKARLDSAPLPHHLDPGRPARHHHRRPSPTTSARLSKRVCARARQVRAGARELHVHKPTVSSATGSR